MTQMTSAEAVKTEKFTVFDSFLNLLSIPRWWEVTAAAFVVWVSTKLNVVYFETSDRLHKQSTMQQEKVPGASEQNPAGVQSRQNQRMT